MHKIRIFPFLAAAYPAVALLSANVGEVRLDAVVRPLVVSLLIVAAVYALIGLMLRDADRAALLTIWIMLLVFAYGHAYDLIKGEMLLGINVGRHRLIFPIWVALMLFGSVAAYRISNPAAWAAPMTVIFSVALAIPILQILFFEVQSARAQRLQARAVTAQLLGQPSAGPGGALPDVYYIILDGYGRQDVLAQSYGYDNTEFISGLERLGFVVAECGRSNYNRTNLSLASSLNFDYLDELRPDGANSDLWVTPLVRDSRVSAILQDLGYTTIAFETGFPATNMDTADLYLSPTAGRQDQIRRLTGFEEIFLRSTVASFVLASLQSLSPGDARDFEGAAGYHRIRILFTLETLENLASYRGPKFVFAHVVAPHEPFVLGPNGEAVQSPPLVDGEVTDEYRKAYADQARYVDGRLIDILDVLLSNPGTPAVLVLQSDHGPGYGSVEDSFRILNAYHYPHAESEIYPAISPVNSFRLIFNSIFGTNLTLLDDVSYYSVSGDPSDVVEISFNCSG